MTLASRSAFLLRSLKNDRRMFAVGRRMEESFLLCFENPAELDAFYLDFIFWYRVLGC